MLKSNSSERVMESITIKRLCECGDSGDGNGSSSNKSINSESSVHTTNAIFMYTNVYAQSRNARIFTHSRNIRKIKHRTIYLLFIWLRHAVCMPHNSHSHTLPRERLSSYQTSFISLDCRITFCVYVVFQQF